MTSNPVVTAIIPFYNGGEYFEQALQSVREQTYDNMEIIVVDDGSDEESRNYLHTLDLEDASLIQHRKNRGISAARNTGVKNSEGKYFAILDQDDKWASNKIREQVQFMENHSAGMVLTNMVHMNEKGEIIEERDFQRNLFQYSAEEIVHYLLEEPFLNEPPLPLTSELVSTSAYERVGGYDTSLYGANDREFMYRLVKNGYQCKILSEQLTYKRYHDLNASKTRRLKLLSDRKKITEIVRRDYPGRWSSLLRKRDSLVEYEKAKLHMYETNYLRSILSFARSLYYHPAYATSRASQYLLNANHFNA